ncbi:AbrB/MazE/SpoVT family DNA-binding domain-containing protein [Glycocaulis sp.]|uniref:AbrB/MazE/SpoVT family DNA-binding domain-containing protein n=1 Tax=Glycocaulis sp. TaxID=1969725 RepID=UPI003D231DF0
MVHQTVQDLRASVAHLPTKSARIRALAKQGLKRADIARALDIRYQHVRNVLVADEEKANAVPIQPDSVTVSVDSAGRVLIPAAFREWFGLQEGSNLVLNAGADGLELLPPSRAADKARALLRPFLEPGLSLSEELIADRRAEAARENG